MTQLRFAWCRMMVLGGVMLAFTAPCALAQSTGEEAAAPVALNPSAVPVPAAPAPATTTTALAPAAVPPVATNTTAAQAGTPLPAAAKPVASLPNSPMSVHHVLPSLFFGRSESEAITQAKQDFFERINTVQSDADLLDQLQGIKASKRSEEDLQDKFYAQFYLQSLMYHTPNDWTVWVKDNKAAKKYVPTMPVAATDELKIIAINKEEATFEWHPHGWQYVLSHFHDDNPLVQLDKNRQMVIFTLRVNETMAGSDLQIKQGVVNVVAVTDTPPPAQPSAVLQPTKSSGPTPVAGQQPLAKGVLGLYKDLDSVNKTP